MTQVQTYFQQIQSNLGQIGASLNKQWNVWSGHVVNYVQPAAVKGQTGVPAALLAFQFAGVTLIAHKVTNHLEKEWIKGSKYFGQTNSPADKFVRSFTASLLFTFPTAALINFGFKALGVGFTTQQIVGMAVASAILRMGFTYLQTEEAGKAKNAGKAKKDESFVANPMGWLKKQMS